MFKKIILALKLFFHPQSPAVVYKHPHILYNNIKGKFLNLLLKIYHVFTKSSNVSCSICGWQGYKFGYLAAVSVDALEENEICPVCKSNGRTRSIVDLLASIIAFDQNEMSIVDVGAARATRRFFNKYPHITYRVADRYKNADIECDITDIPLPDNSVDSLICCHVLEHIDEYERGMRELLRILKPGHPGIIAVPQTAGLKKSKPTNITIFEGYGHVWEFGDDFSQILQDAGFEVETRVVLKNGSEAEPFHIVQKAGT